MLTQSIFCVCVHPVGRFIAIRANLIVRCAAIQFRLTSRPKKAQTRIVVTPTTNNTPLSYHLHSTTLRPCDQSRLLPTCPFRTGTITYQLLEFAGLLLRPLISVPTDRFGTIKRFRKFRVLCFLPSFHLDFRKLSPGSVRIDSCCATGSAAA